MAYQELSEIHERIFGYHLSSSKTFTATRCSFVSSRASMTVGRRPAPPGVVRTNVALISANPSSMQRADASFPTALLPTLPTTPPTTPPHASHPTHPPS